MDGNRCVVLGLFHKAAFEWTKSRVVAPTDGFTRMSVIVHHAGRLGRQLSFQRGDEDEEIGSDRSTWKHGDRW